MSDITWLPFLDFHPFVWGPAFFAVLDAAPTISFAIYVVIRCVTRQYETTNDKLMVEETFPRHPIMCMQIVCGNFIARWSPHVSDGESARHIPWALPPGRK